MHEHPMMGLCQQWLHAIKLAGDVKFDKFGKYALEARKFFDGNHNFMWEPEYASGEGGFLNKEVGNIEPNFKMTVNRIFEAVALYGPALYHQNPTVLATARQHRTLPLEALGLNPTNPMDVQQHYNYTIRKEYQRRAKEAHAQIIQDYSNWIQYDTEKRKHGRRVIGEAVITGLSFFWTEIEEMPKLGIRRPISRFVSEQDVVVDPDAEYWEDVQWVARRRRQPRNVVEDKFQLGEDALKQYGHYTSIQAQAQVYGHTPDMVERTASGLSHDIIEYWEIYSKNGFGQRLKGDHTAHIRANANFQMFGDVCYLAVGKDIPFPLNMPTEAFMTESFDDLFLRAQWPIPLFSIEGGWPFEALYFYEKAKTVWPISLVKPVIGQMRFVNWCMSFLADKVAASCHDYIGIVKAAGKDIQEQIVSGYGPYTIIEISDLFGKTITDVVSFISSPEFNSSIWEMVAQVTDQIDKGLGLTPLMYGMTDTQIRSATEANMRNSNISVRPDDMANQTEECLSRTVTKEIQAARWICSGKDLEPVVGPEAAYVWDSQIRTDDPAVIVRDFDFRIEAGSARKPNLATRIENLVQLGQYALPVMQEMLMGGYAKPWNWFINAWGDAMQLDTTGAQIQLPEQQPGQGQEGGNGESDQAKMMQQAESHEMQMMQRGQQMRIAQEAHQQRTRMNGQRQRQAA